MGRQHHLPLNWEKTIDHIGLCRGKSDFIKKEKFKGGMRDHDPRKRGRG